MEKDTNSTPTPLIQKAREFINARMGYSEQSADEAVSLIKELLERQQQLEQQNAELIDTASYFHKEQIYHNDILNNQPAGLYRIRVSPSKKSNEKDRIKALASLYSVEYVSERFCQILETTCEEYRNNPDILFDLIHPDDKASFVENNEKANASLMKFLWEGRVLIKYRLVWVRLESVPRKLDNDDVFWTGTLYDITEQKRTEEELSETRLELEKVLEGANVGTLEWNVQTGKIKFNAIWARNLGYSKAEIKLGLFLFRSKGWKVITHPDDIPYAEEMLERHFSGELPQHSVEVRMRHKKGHWIWVRQEGKVKTWTADGKPLLMYGTHTNITKRKEMELKLRENEEKYRILFANNPQPMLIYAPKTLDVLEVNQAFINHYGYSREEVLRMSYDELTPPGDRTVKSSWLFRTAKNNERNDEKRHQKKNGEIIYIETKSHTINFQNKMATHVLINDITEQKRAEKALFRLNEELEERIVERTSELMSLNASLRETEIKLKTVTDFTYDWEYWKSPDNKILFMSPSVERLTGYTVSEFEDNPALLDSIIHPSDRLVWDKHKKERCPADPYEQKMELSFRIVTRAGEIRWLGHVCRCIHVDGKFLGVRVSNRDITEGVLAENRMLQITTEVEERERNRFSSELHDGLGPLLSTIKLYFQWLADSNEVDKRKLITEKGNKSIELAIQTARELARGLSSKYVTDLGFVGAIRDFSERINDTNKIQISVKSNTDERVGAFYELMLFRIATELIKNTLTYAQATRIDICFSIEKNKIVFIYTDNGIGFDWQTLKDGKTGLGLMNIQHRVQILKGTIDIDSKIGVGMNTYIEFPLD